MPYDCTLQFQCILGFKTLNTIFHRGFRGMNMIKRTGDLHLFEKSPVLMDEHGYVLCQAITAFLLEWRPPQRPVHDFSVFAKMKTSRPSPQ